MTKGSFPNICPKCKNKDFEYGDIENYGESGLKQTIICTKCDSYFVEYFIVDQWICAK